MQFKIAVLGGDGIGPEVTAEGARVLEAVGQAFGHTFDFEQGLIGGIAMDTTGMPLPDDTVTLCKGADAILFGAVGGPKWDDPTAALRPEQGLLGIRKALGLFANLRPVKLTPALIEASTIKPACWKAPTWWWSES
jgi:3-isopropylmalate dehydrogenase